MAEPPADPTAEKPWYRRISIDIVGKAFALVGAIFYGVLFVAYRLYFKELNLRPEDGAIDNAFLAPRAVGLALICMVIFSFLISFFYYYVVTAGRKLGAVKQGARQLVGLAAGVVLYYSLIFTLPALSKNVRIAVALTIVVICQLVGKWLRGMWTASDERSKTYTLRFSMVAAILVAFVFPVIAIWFRAHDLGVRASHGDMVNPIELFAIPVVDVQTRDVTIEWTATNWPKDLFGSGRTPALVHAKLLAREPTLVTALVQVHDERHIFRLQASSITVSYPGQGTG